MDINLINYIKKYIAITDEEIAIFESYLKPRTLAKKEYLQEIGKVCNARYYILKGCLRLFYIDTKGNEQIIHFGIDNWWITDYESLLDKQPSKLYIQATEPTQVLVLPEEHFKTLCDKIPMVDRLFRLIMEKTYIASQKRLEYMLSMSGEELYNTFMIDNIPFSQRVPQYMLASYLGVTPEFISKLRAKKK